MSSGALTAAERFDVLSRLSLFKSFNAGELEVLAGRFTEVSYRKGDSVWRDGDEADSFLVVVGGELDVWGGKDGEQVVTRLGPGECLGEMALLLDNRRSATVTVGRSATLLTLGKREFRRLTAENPKLLEYFLQVVSKRLAATTRGEVASRQSLVVGVCGEPGVVGKSLVASALAAVVGSYLGDRVVTVRLGNPREAASRAEACPLNDAATASEDQLSGWIARARGGPPVLPVSLPPAGERRSIAAAVDALIDRLTPRFAVVILDAASDPRLEPALLADCSHAVVLLVGRNEDLGASPYAHTRVFKVLNLFSNEARPLPLNSSEPFILPSDIGLVGRGPEEIGERVLQDPWSPASPPLQRLARKLIGISVGIAMGGGAAFGISHVGVLRTLEESGIPVDLVAGTSFGSLVALGYAAGLRSHEMEAIADRIGNKRTTLSALDFTLNRPGLLAGRRLKAIFSPSLGSAETFEHLVLPCRTVATDIESGDAVVIGTGRLDDAFRASCSVPLLWAPVRRDGRTLVDGALVDPVPAAVVREMGADLCIGVNVVPTLKKGVTTVLSRASRAVNSLNPFSYINESRDMPNIFDVGMNSLQVLQYELGNFRALSADVRLNVDLSSYTWIEFYRARELIERGAEAAEAIVPEVRKRISERLPAEAGPRSPDLGHGAQAATERFASVESGPG
jgi:NTE family protein